jgi:hypothetical protein
MTAQELWDMTCTVGVGLGWEGRCRRHPVVMVLDFAEPMPLCEKHAIAYLVGKCKAIKAREKQAKKLKHAA